MAKIYFTKEAIADAIRVAFNNAGEFINVKPEDEYKIHPMRAIKYEGCMTEFGKVTVEVVCDCMQIKSINLWELAQSDEKLFMYGVHEELVNEIYDMINK